MRCSGFCPDVLAEMAMTMTRGTFLLYPIHAVLLNLNVELKQNRSHNGHKLVKFLPVEYQEDNSVAQG